MIVLALLLAIIGVIKLISIELVEESISYSDFGDYRECVFYFLILESILEIICGILIM